MILPSVLDPFFAIARSDPDRPAVVDNGVTVGYGQLARWAGAVADLVAVRSTAGAPPVAVHVHHSVRDIAAVLGILAAGRGYVPVADGPEGHADRALHALGCRELVATAETGRLPAVDRVLRPHWGPSRAPLREAGQPVRALDPAYVLFTSGSTGAPRAAAVPHRALHAVLPHLIRRYGAGPGTIALNFHRLDGDTSLEEILPALLTGGLVVLDEDGEADLDRVLTDNEVTLVNLPVDYWHLYTGHLLDTGRALPRSLETVVIGGEAVRADMLERWRRLGAHDVVLLNTYGSTETALVTHSAVLAGPGAPADFPDGVPIGRPLPSVRQAVAPGAEDPDGPGELLVAGPQLATGYVDDPVRTAARFTGTDPDGTDRWYRTGDLVTEGGDGALVFHGRIDHQVKIRGHRVDLLDVEEAVGRLPGVAAAAAAAHTKGDHTVLVAFVVLTPGASGRGAAQESAAALRERLSAAVPGPLVPDRIVAVPALLHTRTGKVDRAATRDRYL
ncbi:nonribosomal peptide synthetase protein VioO [Streptomyces sp. Ag109_G2-6]|uniref:AMP-binding protein n=1 Tax=Streptomyces TaxID=1883 RepID=UPI0009A509A7|nr:MULTISPECIES: AMP-binding protein [Streptomyces]RPF44209.1 nonribosomal peptide synthetase protein VioO [Streptomyces sp. Ag109_G2-6]